MEFSLNLEPKAGQLRPQHNQPGESGTRENALEYDPDERTLVNVRIDTVQYGIYDEMPAALILLHFKVKFRPAKRIRNFHINLEFRNQSDNESGEIKSHPRVIKLAPEELRGKIFTEERSTTSTAGADMPLGPTGANLHLNGEMASTINREYELKLSGWKKSSDIATDNVVVWDCAEAKKAARGVVPGYRGAIIVKHSANEPFIAMMKLDAERGIFNFDKKVFEYLNVFGKKEMDDPLIFDPEQPLGEQYPDLGDFKNINLEDYIKLEPIKMLPTGYS